MLQGFFPRFHVIHTSRKILGQVYIPIVNYMLMTLTLIVVGIFEKSSKLGQAYGEDVRLCFSRFVLGAVVVPANVLKSDLTTCLSLRQDLNLHVLMAVPKLLRLQRDTQNGRQTSRNAHTTASMD
jgi:K+ transporter